MFLIVLLVLLSSPAGAQPALDLDALVRTECGPTGYRRPAGCTVQLPKGEFEIQPTKLGTCESTSTQRLGLTLQGQGSSIGAMVPRYSTAGTTLVCKSSTCLSVCGSDVWIKDLNIEGYGSDVGIEWRANNTRSAISHFGGVERVIVRGPKMGARIFGEGYNDQLDFIVFRDSKLVDVDVGFEQDSQQAVNNTLANVEVAARAACVVNRNGGIIVDGGYCGQWPLATGAYDPTFIGYWGTRSANPAVAWMSRAKFDLRDMHVEIHAGTFVKDDSGSWYTLWIERPLFQQVPPTAAAASRSWSIDANFPGKLVLSGVEWTASTPSGVRAVPRICRRGGPTETFGLSWTRSTEAPTWACRNGSG